MQFTLLEPLTHQTRRCTCAILNPIDIQPHTNTLVTQAQEMRSKIVIKVEVHTHCGMVSVHAVLSELNRNVKASSLACLLI